jgi:hypothetical protein
MSEIKTVSEFINELEEGWDLSYEVSVSENIFHEAYLPNVQAVIENLKKLDPNKIIETSIVLWDEEEILRIELDIDPEERDRINKINEHKNNPSYLIGKLQDEIERISEDVMKGISFEKKHILIEKSVFNIWKKEIIFLSKLDNKYGKSINEIFRRISDE